MNSKVIAFELQDDKTVRNLPVTLRFPRPNDSRLYIITNQKSKCHLCQDPQEKRGFKKTSSENSDEKMFQYGVSTKVFSVTDPTGSAWEVRVLLSPSEISRLSSSFNLIGCFSTYLVSKEFRQDFQGLINGVKNKDAAKEICEAMTPFLCLLDDDKVKDFCAELKKVLNTTITKSCLNLPEEDIMVAGGLAALLAADLASSLRDSNVFDYKGEKTESQENLKEQVNQMLKTFNIEAEQLTVPYQDKTVRVIFRNPCPDNWASGGRKVIKTGETFEFGLCHRVFSISEGQSEIQFLQSLQESYDMVTDFHVAAFAEHLLMTKKWRKSLEVLLKEGHKEETVEELSQLAAKFVCNVKSNKETFQKCFRKEMREKWSQILPAGGEAISVFGLLVAIMAGQKAKFIADNPTYDIILEAEQDDALENNPIEVAPNGDESGHPEPSTIGPNMENHKDTVDEETADNTLLRGLADGCGNENSSECNVEKIGSSRKPGVEATNTGTPSSYQDDVKHPCPEEKSSGGFLISSSDDLGNGSNIATSGPPGDVLPTVDPQTALGSQVSCLTPVEPQTALGSQVSCLTPVEPQTALGSQVSCLTPVEPQTALGSQVSCQGPLESQVDVQQAGGLHTSNVNESDNGKDDRQDLDEATGLSVESDITVGHVYDFEGGPNPRRDSSSKDTEKSISQDEPKVPASGDESLTMKSQNDLSTQMSQETNKTEAGQQGQGPHHQADEGKVDTSQGPAGESSYLMMLVILIVLIVIAWYVLSSRFTMVLFTGLALLLGVYMFLSRTS